MASKQTWMTRFVDAFNACLERDPDSAPSPTMLNVELGRRRSNQINGREASLRRELLESAGFVKDRGTNRWVRA